MLKQARRNEGRWSRVCKIFKFLTLCLKCANCISLNTLFKAFEYRQTKWYWHIVASCRELAIWPVLWLNSGSVRYRHSQPGSQSNLQEDFDQSWCQSWLEWGRRRLSSITLSSNTRSSFIIDLQSIVKHSPAICTTRFPNNWPHSFVHVHHV